MAERYMEQQASNSRARAEAKPVKAQKGRQRRAGLVMRRCLSYAALNIVTRCGTAVFAY